MKQDIIINSTTSESRIALLEDDVLVELFVERPENERMVGSLYRGEVRKILPGISAAFIDIGFSQDAFLHFSDVGGGNELGELPFEPVLERDKGTASDQRRRWDASDLKVGQKILVQVIKEPIGRKGPRVSSQISIPGRFLVLVPNENFTGVSRKITNFREKKRLKKIIADHRPRGFGQILRTQTEGKDEKSIKEDLQRAMKTWKMVEREMRDLEGPGLVYRDMTMASSIIRDLFSREVNSLVVDSRSFYREIKSYIKDIAPNLVSRIHHYTDQLPIFDKFGIEIELEKCLSRKVWLSGGGYIYFDHTEALVAIDVNSGRFVGKRDHEENVLKVNLKAAKEICRQLRLRDMGGILVIDFIDMASERSREQVFNEMRVHMRNDRSKWDMAPIGPFGLLEMTRQRIRPALLYTLRIPCPNCVGTGLVPSVETVATTIERWIKRFASQTREKRLKIVLNTSVKEFLTKGIRSRLAMIMWNNSVFVTLTADEDLLIDGFKAFSQKQKRDVTADFMVGANPKRNNTNH